MTASEDQSFEEEFLSCTICTEIYTDPCTLRCQHSFCRKCVTDYIKTRPEAVQSKTIPCAMCRQVTPVPNPTRPVEEWAKQQKPSFMLQGLMDRHKRDHRYNEGEDICFLCREIGETIPALSWCSDCEVTLCSRCVKRHQKGPATRKHDMYDLSKGSSIKQKRKTKCKEHEGEQIKFICKDCNKAVCQTCCILKHAKHNISTIEAMVPEIRNALTEKRRVIKMKIVENMVSLNKEEANILQLKVMKTRAGSEITSTINMVITLLREKERELRRKLDDTSDRQIAEHQANVKTCQITNQVYKQHCEFIDQSLQSESEIDMYDMYQVCLSGAVEFISDIESDTMKNPVVGDIRFMSNIAPIKQAITEIGEVCFTSLTESTKRNISNNITETGVVGVTLHKEITQKSEKRSSLKTALKVVFHDTIDLKHKQDKARPSPIDVVLLTLNGVDILVAADYNNKCLKSIVRNKDKRNDISRLPLPSIPRSLTRITRNRIAATIENVPHIIVAEVRPTGLIFISTLTTKKEYSGLTSLSDSTLVAGSSSPPAVDILDLTGTVIKSFTPVNTGLDLIRNPWYLCTTQNGNILVSDLTSKCVYCLTTTGVVVFTFKPMGLSMFGGPLGITVTNTGGILLAQWMPNKIIQLSSDGSQARDIDTSGGDVGQPWGLCVNDTAQLYVCDRGGASCIKVYCIT